MNTFKCQEFILLLEWEYYLFFMLVGDSGLLHTLIKSLVNKWMNECCLKDNSLFFWPFSTLDVFYAL